MISDIYLFIKNLNSEKLSLIYQDYIGKAFKGDIYLKIFRENDVGYPLVYLVLDGNLIIYIFESVKYLIYVRKENQNEFKFDLSDKEIDYELFYHEVNYIEKSKVIDNLNIKYIENFADPYLMDDYMFSVKQLILNRLSREYVIRNFAFKLNIYDKKNCLLYFFPIDVHSNGFDYILFFNIYDEYGIIKYIDIINNVIIFSTNNNDYYMFYKNTRVKFYNDNNKLYVYKYSTDINNYLYIEKNDLYIKVDENAEIDENKLLFEDDTFGKSSINNLLDFRFAGKTDNYFFINGTYLYIIIKTMIKVEKDFLKNVIINKDLSNIYLENNMKPKKSEGIYFESILYKKNGQKIDSKKYIIYYINNETYITFKSGIYKLSHFSHEINLNLDELNDLNINNLRTKIPNNFIGLDQDIDNLFYQ